MPFPEVLLWQQLRASKRGVRFRHQHPIAPYVVDFYCPSARLVVEIDGEAHDRGSRPAADEARARFLTENGYRLLRLPARYLLTDIDGALASITLQAALPLHQPAAGPPPRAGEDQKA